MCAASPANSTRPSRYRSTCRVASENREELSTPPSTVSSPYTARSAAAISSSPTGVSRVSSAGSSP